MGWEGEAPAEPRAGRLERTDAEHMECGGSTPLWLPAERAKRKRVEPQMNTDEAGGGPAKHAEGRERKMKMGEPQMNADLSAEASREGG